jgi:large subunit ribosomal protein L27
LAHKKGLGSSRNGRDSNGQRLGVKVYGGERVSSGTIIIRQRGTRIMPGLNVGLAKDDSIYATADGVVKFERKGRDKKIVSIVP